ncbi:50S ribosome-binding GTPase [Candidatus Woesearchaeota archaeon]|nr:50S ribosome-binding GTPase [Candidatus Woesearchaeota archaeon]
MNFQTLVTIETSDRYLKTAFSRAREAAEKTREKPFANRFSKSKAIEVDKVVAAHRTLTKSLKTILVSFPSIDQLDPFYQELIRTTLDYAQLKRSLGSINWALQKVMHLGVESKQTIYHCQDMTALNKHRRGYFGRVSSFMKQVSRDLEFLEAARKIMKGYPAIKTAIPTVCICGFPNVGKSTLLGRLTPAKPEIKNYAFTTKQLNLGYLKEAQHKIQLIDTPGTLDRLEKMNDIEKQAYLAVKHCADVIVYIIDLTESSYPLDKQLALLEKLKAFGKPTILYFSKTDLLDKALVDSTISKRKLKEVITDIDELKKDILARGEKLEVKIARQRDDERKEQALRRQQEEREGFEDEQ